MAKPTDQQTKGLTDSRVRRHVKQEQGVIGATAAGIGSLKALAIISPMIILIAGDAVVAVIRWQGAIAVFCFLFCTFSSWRHFVFVSLLSSSRQTFDKF